MRFITTHFLTRLRRGLKANTAPMPAVPAAMALAPSTLLDEEASLYLKSEP
jgi:hypothetical protein